MNNQVLKAYSIGFLACLCIVLIGCGEEKHVGYITEYALFCEFCGTPRPQEPTKKSLEDELMDAYTDQHYSTEVDSWKIVAAKARSYILDGKEEEIIKILEQFPSSGYKSISESILNHLRESSR